MIKIKPQGSRSLATGENIPNPATTFLETGPKDELGGADAYTGMPSQFKTGVGSAIGSVSGAVSGAVGSAGGLVGSSDTQAQRAAQLAGRATTTTGRSLWTALLCGAFETPPDTSDQTNARSQQTALWLRSTGCSAENLIGLISTQNGISLDRDELERRLSSAMGQSMYSLEPEFRESMIQSMAEMTGQDAATLTLAMNNVQSNVKTDRQGDASALASILSNVTGSEEVIEVFDLHAETAVLGALLDQAIDLGIPQAVETLLAQIENEDVRRRVALERLRLAAMSSQLSTVRSIVTMTGSEAALAKVPDLIPLITQNYSWGSNVRSSEYPAKRDELIETLSLITPRWHLKLRDGQWVSNLEPFSMASSDALTLFKMSDYVLQASIAPTYPKRNYVQVARQYHPRVAIGYNYSYL